MNNQSKEQKEQYTPDFKVKDDDEYDALIDELIQNMWEYESEQEVHHHFINGITGEHALRFFL